MVLAIPRQLASMSGGSAGPGAGITLSELERRAAAVRSALDLPAHADEEMKIELAFAKADGSKRGWSNWLVPGRLMVGRYPHLDPIAAAPRAGSRAFTGGPSEQCVSTFLQEIVHTHGVDTFVCLQNELPPQDRPDAWPRDGHVYLASAEGRARFPGPFVRYADAVLEVIPEGRRAPTFIHFPIVDLSLPQNSDATYALLADLLERMVSETPEASPRALYVHCWGGRGRAGLIGGCLLALLRTDMSGADVVRTVQAGYDSRAGSKAQKGALAFSPQTPEQREWLANFADSVHQLRAS
jgi:alanine transaminase